MFYKTKKTDNYTSFELIGGMGQHFSASLIFKMSLFKNGFVMQYPFLPH